MSAFTLDGEFVLEACKRQYRLLSFCHVQAVEEEPEAETRKNHQRLTLEGHQQPFQCEIQGQKIF